MTEAPWSYGSGTRPFPLCPRCRRTEASQTLFWHDTGEEEPICSHCLCEALAWLTEPPPLDGGDHFRMEVGR